MERPAFHIEVRTATLLVLTPPPPFLHTAKDQVKNIYKKVLPRICHVLHVEWIYLEDRLHQALNCHAEEIKNWYTI